ncbi:lymphocyte activation gene 3 protein [Pleuronectes platessa]|uniref:lymphocyte activation gene 3 protein n=1 Tax=Pleuronectes platessa TaxID=8262 RepID=UPI00232A5B98|nr:lymphocyte activation gene 3 protein [Pleuronectes platessa]
MMSLECFIFILMTFLVTGVQCDMTEVFAEVGSLAVLPCQYSPASNVSPRIIWSKAGKGTVWRMEKSGLQMWGSSWSPNGNQRVRCPHTQFERGHYSLQILGVTEEDGGVYSCRVEQGGLSVETVVMLRIITVSISPSAPMSGKDVSFTCQVTPGFDGSAAAVQWMLNDSRFSRQTRVTSPGDKFKSIVKEKASPRLSGNWTCVVGYGGKEGRASAPLTVTGIIQPPFDDTKVYAAVGSAVTLPCVFSSGLIPSSPLWEKLQPGSLNKRAPSRVAPSFSPSSPSSQLPWDQSASLKEVDLKDEGKYRCSGTIEGERLARNIQLVVAKIDSSVPSKKKGSVTLTCQVSDTSEVTQHEWVRVTYDLNGTEAFGSIHKGKTLSISPLSEESWGTWACRFSGRDGTLGNITYHVPMMSGLSGPKSSGYSQNTTAVVGLSVFLLALLLILAQLYKNHRRKQGIFQYPAMETIIHTVSNEREEREKYRVKVLP